MQSNIRKLRKKRGLTQKELGEKIGVSQQVISRMEMERELISVDVLLHLATYFKVSTDCVLGYQEQDEKISHWMREMTTASISKEDVLMMLENADNIRSREWLYLWFLINVLNERK